MSRMKDKKRRKKLSITLDGVDNFYAVNLTFFFATSAAGCKYKTVKPVQIQFNTCL
jgi:hypothetical protein